MFLFFRIRFLLYTTLRRAQKYRSKKRSGAAQANPPFASCATRQRVELEDERAPAAFLEGAAAGVAERVLEELQKEARMVHGRARVDKHDLPAE